jgi:hypothetical protein
VAESRPEFTRPSVGDELILFKRAVRTQPEQRIPVRVIGVARFRVVLEGIDGERLPWWGQEYDIRSQKPWDKRWSYEAWELHTPETLAYKLKQKQVEAFMSEHGIRTYTLRGALRKKVDADPLAFVNLLKEWIGEETI